MNESTPDDVLERSEEGVKQPIEGTASQQQLIQPEKEKHPENKHNEDPHNKAHNNGKHGNIIIIKKVKKHVHKHHGGAWKIAYADFVTAMMTFFLLLWLLSMLNKYQLEGIAAYFKDPAAKSNVQQVDPKLDKVKIENKVETTNKLKIPQNQPNQAQIDRITKQINTEAISEATSNNIKKDLEEQLNKNPKLSEFKNSLNLKVVTNGLKIELKDLENKVMFSSGKSDFGDYAKEILTWLGPALNKYPNRIMIIGHTDSKPFNGSPGYTNWELSADRSNATRRELINHGMQPEKIIRVSGMADTDKLETAKDKEDPTNRRIAIIVLSDDAYQKIIEE